MRKTGIDNGVLELDDLIDYLQNIRKNKGNMKIAINGQLQYEFKGSVEVDTKYDCVDFISEDC